MLNITPITTAIMLQFIYNFIIFNNKLKISIVMLQTVVLYVVYRYITSYKQV